MTKKTDIIEELLASIRKNHGDESLIRLKDGKTRHKIAVIPSGSVSLDLALGVGGYPRGRIIEVFGPESSGKTTLALHAIAETQKEGGVAAFIDAEHALDLKYADNLGVRTGDILVSQPNSGEQALDIVSALVDSAAIDIIVIDSVAALTPQAEIDGDMGDHHVGVHARLMSQALRKLTGAVSKNNCILFFINQLRSKIGVMYGSPEVTTGGNALKFYASVRVDVRKREQVKDGEANPHGNRTELKVVKNKVAPPFQMAEVEIVWGKGIDKYNDLLTCAVNHKIVEKNGAWFSFEGERLGQGFNAAARALETQPKTFAEIDAIVRKGMFNE